MRRLVEEDGALDGLGAAVEPQTPALRSLLWGCHGCNSRWTDRTEVRCVWPGFRHAGGGAPAPAGTIRGVDHEDFWIRKRAPRRTDPSTTGAKTAMELSDERVEAIRNMTPEELAAFADEMAAQARAGRAAAEEAASERRAWRYLMN